MHKLVSRSRSLIEGKGGRGRRAATKAPVTHAPDEPLHGGPESVSDTTLHVPSYNSYATPGDSSINVDQYASRPLPATPSSIPKMADRPSTSGGPASRKSTKNDFKYDKRMSRDDFYLGSRVYGGTRSGTFPRQPLTPDASPKTKSVQKFTSRANTRELTTKTTLEVREAGIGMALGSPSQLQNFADAGSTQNAARPREDSHSIATPPASRSSSVDTFDMPVLRKPSSKWKLFSIFARKPSDQTVPAISISDPNGLSGTNRPEQQAVAISQTPPPEPKNPTRSNTAASRKGSKHKPILIRSQTMPSNAAADNYDQRRRPGQKQSREPSPASKPLLNVDIPDVRLERYSVMFDGVLKSNPSLLSRRQASIPKLKSIDDAVEREEEAKLHGMSRRATSPQPAAKPSGFVLFPTSRESQGFTPQKLSPRLRSNTSPALLPSPSRATFAHQAPHYRRPSEADTTSLKPRTQSFPYDHENPGIAITTDAEIPERETSPSAPRFSNDQSNLILDSPSEIESGEDEETTTTQAWKPVSYHLPPEPKWQMISPSQKTPSTASSNTSSSYYRKRSPSLASSAHTHITRASEDLDDALLPPSSSASSTAAHPKNGTATAKMTPVEISIARQITVSRQQRKMLQPLRTAMPPPAAPASSISSSSAPAASSGRRPSHPSPARSSPLTVGVPREPGRIAETKTSTPTLVTPPDLLEANLQHAARAQYRRSERIILEDA